MVLSSQQSPAELAVSPHGTCFPSSWDPQEPSKWESQLMGRVKKASLTSSLFCQATGASFS